MGPEASVIRKLIDFCAATYDREQQSGAAVVGVGRAAQQAGFPTQE